MLSGLFTGATGIWELATVGKPSEPQGREGGWNSASWLGLDVAFGSDDVLQAGVEQKINAAGQASYAAWYEWFAQLQSGSPVHIYQANINNFQLGPSHRRVDSEGARWRLPDLGAANFTPVVVSNAIACFVTPTSPRTGDTFNVVANGATLTWLVP